MGSERDIDGSGDAALDDLFARARAARPVVPDDLMARVMADAAAVPQAADATAGWPPQARPARFRSLGGLRSVLRALAEVFGGAGALAGVATAGLAGIWIGLASPSPLAALAPGLLPGLLGDEAAMDLDLFPDVAGFLDHAIEG
ncbi:MAG: dihydroorotate dehydrogenase [Gemmobacter sp.]